jgi:SAM-dependent methyltransferase
VPDAARPGDRERPSVADVLAAKHRWYHVIELADGSLTPGWIDLRQHRRVPAIPADLTGLRALDVGSFDGFWAFEMEQRGATVVALDIDQIPPPDTPRVHVERMRAEADGIQAGTGFRLLREHRGSSVRRVLLNVYDVTAAAIGGPVDVIFLGSLLLHLRDPVGALERLRDVLVPGGRIVLFEPVSAQLEKTKEPTAQFLAWRTPWTWWYANSACLTEWLRAAGFDEPRVGGRVKVRDADGGQQVLLALDATAS